MPVYHHCLFGIRYDFLCANYTAFDQTLFNCNFVSNVDCKNSKNFWSRNDELYKTKPTEPPPALVYSYYTQAPPSGVIPSRRNPLLRRIPQPNVSPVQAETNPAAAPQPTHNPQGPLEVLTPQIPIEVPLAMMPRRRPSRLRPYYDYYYDYEEPQYYRRKRPRPRPYYDDEYDYYEDRYERRGDLRRRRPMRRYLSRRDKYEDEEYDEEYDELEDEEPRRKKTSRGGSAASASRNKPRRQSTRRPVSKTNRKQPDYYEEEYEDEPVNKKPASESSKNRPTNRRPTFEYDEEEDNPRGRRRDDDKTMIKPTSGTIFDRPRMAPKVNLPVPKNVADKYSYKAMNAKNKEPTEEYSSAVGKSTEKSTTPDNHDVTTMRGNFKRPYLTRRPASSNSHEGSTANRRTKSEDEIQVSKAVKQAAVRVKIPAEVAQKDSKRQPDRRTQSRINMYKSRHSLSTSEGQDADSEDLTEIEIDDSINEA